MVSIEAIPPYGFKQEKRLQEPSPRYANDEAPGKVKPKKGKVKRTVFTKYQQDSMEARFREQNFLSKEERIDLAKDLGLSERHVMIWFQNRRGKLKRRGPQDAAYTAAKFEELCCERPHPILYGMLASLQHKNQLLKPYSAMIDNSAQGAVRNTMPMKQEMRNQTEEFYPQVVDARNLSGASLWNTSQQLSVNTNACFYGGNTSYPWNQFASVQKQALLNNGYSYNQTIQNQIPSLSMKMSDICESQTQKHISPTGSQVSHSSYDTVNKDSNFKSGSEQLVPSMTSEGHEDYLTAQSYESSPPALVSSTCAIQPMRQNQVTWWETSQSFNDCMYKNEKNAKNELL